MKKNALRFLLATICLMMLTLSSKAQLWGTLPGAFYTVSLQDSVYSEVFKDINFGRGANPGIFMSPDTSLYGSTPLNASSPSSTIFRYVPGELSPQLLFKSDSSSLGITLADFTTGYLYGSGR